MTNKLVVIINSLKVPKINNISLYEMKRIYVLDKKKREPRHIKRNKIVSEKVATTCTEDGHRQTTKTSTTI